MDLTSGVRVQLGRGVPSEAYTTAPDLGWRWCSSNSREWGSRDARPKVRSTYSRSRTEVGEGSSKVDIPQDRRKKVPERCRHLGPLPVDLDGPLPATAAA